MNIKDNKIIITVIGFLITFTLSTFFTSFLNTKSEIQDIKMQIMEIKTLQIKNLEYSEKEFQSTATIIGGLKSDIRTDIRELRTEVKELWRK